MTESKAYRLSFIALSIFWGLYLILRAYLNPLVFDEATSYFLFIKNGTFWPGTAFWSANNHLLNSGLAWLSTQIFGLSEGSLRLANLAAFPLFAYYVFRLLSTLKSPFLRWWTLILFFSLHAILEFFAYARGYGLMLAFLFAALWQLRSFFRSGKMEAFLWLIAFSLLSLLSYVSALPLIAVMLLSGTVIYHLSQRSLLSKLGATFLAFLPLAFALWWSFSLKEHQQLYYGGETGFISDSLESLKEMLLFESINIDILLAPAALFLLAFIATKPWQKESWSGAQWMVWAFTVITLFYPLGHLILGLKFPFDRALIYWFCFGLVAFIGLLDWHYQQGTKSLVFFSVWSLVFPLSFFAKVSLNSVSFPSWSKEQVPLSFYHELVENKVQNFGGSYLQAPQWNFLQQKQGAEISNFQVSDSPWLDYRLCEEENLARWLGDYYQINDNGAGLHLLRRKQLSTKKALGSFKAPSLNNHTGGQAILEGDLDGSFQAIGGQLHIKVKTPHKLAVAVQALNETEEQVYWQAYRAREYLRPEKGWQEWRLFVVLKDLPQDSKRLKLFIWNPENEVFSIQESEWTVWDLN